ncbi:unnamed protein product [Blepharisma stoltei]|uniref:Uncharacterized protein n=1 Tax=Blepharisma stoltei TaxID=1481888 RepID=A0AAU9IED5_9CILI|nr:unnamed protein product [Blepharisma stoltei]
MNLDYIVGNDPKHIKRLDELGCDLDALFFSSKDFFSVLDDLKLSMRDSTEFFMRLKYINDIAKGNVLPANIRIFENNRILPTRLLIQNYDNGKKISFRVIPGQGSLEKGNVLYQCEACADERGIKRRDSRNHLYLRHKNLT